MEVNLESSGINPVTPPSMTSRGRYQDGTTSYVEGLRPDMSQRMSVYDTLDLLSARYGFETIQEALRAGRRENSPRKAAPNGDWLKTTRMVGINVRTVGSFFNVVKYALTLPSFHDSIHLLPVWEPGVVGSLYGMSSWHINSEFFSTELYGVFPDLNSPEKQLQASLNLLHVMGFSVGMDVIPHTDRFSEMVLAYPRFFEWVRQENGILLDHSEGVGQQVEELVYSFLKENGTADSSVLPTFDYLFGEKIQLSHEAERLKCLFGEPNAYGVRQARRIALMRYVIAQGYETLPMTMAPPYRGLTIDPEVYIQDDTGHPWYQYKFESPQVMSRVFGPLARYRLFHSKDDNKNWELDFDRPIPEVWAYVQHKYAEAQREFGFDFMRGDMTHVQMRPAGVPDVIPDYYDLLGSVKDYIVRKGTPSFAFFAESFIGAPDFMGYGDEITHLEAIDSEVTLGDLQSTIVGSELFSARFRQYLDVASTRHFKPCFTVMTADKDDPRFDEFYQTGNLVRYFIALFMTDLPSYTGAGFEIRNQHEERGKNEEYSKLYVFQIFDEKQTDKCTSGPYVWGQNAAQFEQVTQLRAWAEQLLPSFEGHQVKWHAYPDPTGSHFYIGWQVRDYVFICNLNGREVARHVSVPQKDTSIALELIYTSEGTIQSSLVTNGRFYSLPSLAPSECRIYKLINNKQSFAV